MQRFLLPFYLILSLLACKKSTPVDTQPMPEPGTDLPKNQWLRLPFVSQEVLSKGFIGGEGGQWSQALAIDNKDGQFVLFGTDVGGISRSTDGGKTWEPCNVGFSARGCMGFAIDPNNTSRVLAIGGNSGKSYTKAHGVYLSTDKGVTWNIRYATDELCGYRDHREQIVFDKSSFDAGKGYSQIAYWSRENRNTCVYGTTAIEAALYKSTDGGQSWNALPNSIDYAGSLVKVHPTKGIVYIANQNGVFRSTNQGASFTQTFAKPTGGMDISAAEPDKVFLVAQDGVYVSTNAGENFTKVSSGSFPAFQAIFLNVSPVNTKRMVIQVRRGQYDSPRFYSQDGGATWAETQVDKRTNRFLPWNGGREGYSCWHPTNENVFWTVSADNIDKSEDGGKTQVWASNGLTAVFVGSIFNFSTTKPNVLALPTQDYNAAVTTNLKTWTYLNMSNEGWGGYVYGAYSPDGQTVVAGRAPSWNGPRKLSISFDDGRTYSYTNTDIGGKYVGYGDPNDAKILFIGNLRSTDGGQNWKTMNGCEGVFTSNPTGGKELYGVNDKTVVRSTNRGETWEPTGTVPDDNIEDIAYDHVTNQLYVATEKNLFVINRQNGSVTSLSANAPTDQFGNRRFNSVTVDPVNPAVVYVGSHRDIYNTDVAVIRSEDSGKTWKPLTFSTRFSNVQSGVPGGSEAFCVRVNPATRCLVVVTSCYGNWQYCPVY